MAVPGIDMLSGPPAASSRRVARRSAEPALRPHPELPCTHEWPLRSYRELRARPRPCAPPGTRPGKPSANGGWRPSPTRWNCWSPRSPPTRCARPPRLPTAAGGRAGPARATGAILAHLLNRESVLIRGLGRRSLPARTRGRGAGRRGRGGDCCSSRPSAHNGVATRRKARPTWAARSSGPLHPLRPHPALGLDCQRPSRTLGADVPAAVHRWCSGACRPRPRTGPGSR